MVGIDKGISDRRKAVRAARHLVRRRRVAKLELLVEKASYLFELGQYQQALEICQSVLEEFPKDPACHLLKVSCLINLDRFEEAEAAAFDCVRYASNRPEPYAILSKFLARSGTGDVAKRLEDYARRLGHALDELSEDENAFSCLPVLWSETYPAEQEHSAKRKSPPLMLSTELWGSAYLKTFLDYCVPSLLAPGNLPRVARTRPDSLFVISLPIPDYLAFKHHPMFERLRRNIALRIDVIKQPPANESKYDGLVFFQNLKLREAGAEGVIYAAMYPDGVLADGSLSSALDTIDTGKKVFLDYAPRLELESFERRLTNDPEARSFEELVCLRRHLVHMALACRHRGFANFGVESFCHTEFPSSVTWTVRGQGLAVRTFHMYPMLIHPDLLAGAPEIEITLDDSQFIGGLIRSLDDLYVATDSDTYFAFSLSRRDDPGVPYPEELACFSRERVLAWFEEYGSPYNLHLATHRIRIKMCEPDEALWEPIEREGEALVTWLKERLAFDGFAASS